MRRLVSGHKGFLFSNISDLLGGTVVPYNYGSRYFGIGMVIHFASPSDRYDFPDKQNMAFTMVDYSQSILEEAINNNAKFVFASSVAAEMLVDDYGVYKRFFEQYIQAKTDNHLILRIPRVYSKQRNKGLMKQLRLGDVPAKDMNRPVDYIDIEDFKVWFIDNIDKTGIISYNKGFRRHTIQEIKEIYI